MSENKENIKIKKDIEQISKEIDDLKNIVCQNLFLSTILVNNLGEKIERMRHTNGGNFSKRSSESD